MKKRDEQILTTLRADGRASLTSISKKTKVPISTVYERLKQMKGIEITKHCTLLNFKQLGYHGRAFVMLKCTPESRESIKNYLITHENVNTLFKINAGLDFMLELIFLDIKAVEDFLDGLELKYPILQKQVHYIIDELSREQFMTLDY